MQALFGSELSATKSNTSEPTKSLHTYLLEDDDDSWWQDEDMTTIEVNFSVFGSSFLIYTFKT